MIQEVCPHSVSQNWNGDASCNKKRDAAFQQKETPHCDVSTIIYDAIGGLPNVVLRSEELCALLNTLELLAALRIAL